MNHQTAKSVLVAVTLSAIILSGCTTKPSPTPPPTPTISPSAEQTASPSATTTASPSATSKSAKSATPKSTTQPLIDCVGPDGKTIKLTQKACTDFQSAWNKQSPSPSTTTAQVTGCGAYNPTGALSTARVSVKIESGQTWVGQAGFDFSQKYSECKGNGLDYPYKDVISSETTRDFGGLRPGPYKVEVTYHGKSWSTDVNLNGGTSEVTVTVSNN